MEKPAASVDHRPSSRVWTALAAAFLLAQLLALSACSQTQEEVAAQPYPPPNPLFYELANADGEVEGWLLGTIHALPEGVLWRTEAIDDAIGEADLLWVEVANLGATGEIARTFAELSQSPDLTPIEERISKPLRSQMTMMLADSQFSAADLSAVEDWAAAIMLTQASAVGDPANGVDRAVIAQFHDREVRGFETASTQLGIFDKLAQEDQRELLEGTIEGWSKSRDDPQWLMRAWLEGNIAALTNATNEGIMADLEIRDALLVKRNADWMAQLAPILSDAPRPLIAVGAAHLVGDDGLVKMLRDTGYNVTRVSSS